MKAFYDWYDEILVHIRENGLRNLSEYEYNGANPFSTFTDITKSKQSLKDFSYSDFKHGDEFQFLSMDLIYAISIIELLHPKINDAVNEDGTYMQTVEDHIYLRYAGYALQTIYSFWDRIGDFLDIFYETKQKNDIYISRVFQRFPEEHRSNTFEKLKKLYEDNVLPILEERHQVVHGFTLKGRYYWEVIEYGRENPDKLKALQEEKSSYPNTFRKQLDFMFEGFRLALTLVSELPNKEINIC
ncbi:MAG TPA: Cthe_2314 family HEPN domain-containing protein [Daejeonella sp.]|nr:Cthe_2314 family HEPN domain-containing protein [Daejeonella sp.]